MPAPSQRDIQTVSAEALAKYTGFQLVDSVGWTSSGWPEGDQQHVDVLLKSPGEHPFYAATGDSRHMDGRETWHDYQEFLTDLRPQQRDSFVAAFGAAHAQQETIAAIGRIHFDADSPEDSVYGYVDVGTWPRSAWSPRGVDYGGPGFHEEQWRMSHDGTWVRLR